MVKVADEDRQWSQIEVPRGRSVGSQSFRDGMVRWGTLAVSRNTQTAMSPMSFT